jgi:LytS/YehU family sensor histidine kinase
MERLVQCLDDLEDLFYAIALKAERIRQAVQFFLFIATSAVLQMCGILVALRNPPLAVALASLLMVGMLFRAVIGFSQDGYAA